MITQQEYDVLRRYDYLLNSWKCGKSVSVNRLAYQELQPIAHHYTGKNYLFICRGCILHLLQDCYNLREAYTAQVPVKRRRRTNNE